MASQPDDSSLLPPPASQVRRLAVRYARRVNRRWDAVRADLKAQKHAIDEARGRLSAEVAQFHILRSEFHAVAADAKDRLRQNWAAAGARQQRSAAEWAETTDYFGQQEAALAARPAELAVKEQAVAGAKAAAEAVAAALRAEAAGLEARAANAREVVADLERRRDQLHAELLSATAPSAPPSPGGYQVALDRAGDRDLAAWADELDARDRQLSQEKAALTAVKASLDRGATELEDGRRVLAEQFVKLAEARAEWQAAERRTVAELEELAGGLRVREVDLDAREGRLAQADARRREDAYDLWQLRLRLEAWQAKLTTTDQRWHAGRQAREAAADRRLAAIARREAEMDGLVGKWEQARQRERERLRAELLTWADDRERMARAAREADERARAALAEVASQAARAVAAEEALAGAVPGADPKRLEVARKRWEQVLVGRLAEVEARRAEVERLAARADRRLTELRERVEEVTGQEGEAATRTARAELEQATTGGAVWGESGVSVAGADTGREAAELVSLRREVERMAGVLLDAARPELPDSELPWAGDEPGVAAGPTTLPFRRAA